VGDSEGSDDKDFTEEKDAENYELHVIENYHYETSNHKQLGRNLLITDFSKSHLVGVSLYLYMTCYHCNLSAWPSFVLFLHCSNEAENNNTKLRLCLGGKNAG
jgi:hypothetical protein